MEIEQKKQDKIKIFMLIGIYFAIFTLVLTIVVLMKNVNEIKTDPITYGITQKDFVACRCQDSQMRNYYYNGTGNLLTEDYYNLVNEVLPDRKCPTLEFNLTEFNLTK